MNEWIHISMAFLCVVAGTCCRVARRYTAANDMLLFELQTMNVQLYIHNASEGRKFDVLVEVASCSLSLVGVRSSNVFEIRRTAAIYMYSWEEKGPMLHEASYNTVCFYPQLHICIYRWRNRRERYEVAYLMAKNWRESHFNALRCPLMC